MHKNRFELTFILASVVMLFLLYIYGAIYGAAYAVNEKMEADNYVVLIQQAEAGDVWAQSYLGYLYYIGEGVPQDYVESIKWYRMAAAKGNKDAQYNIAVAHAFGKGVPKDLTKAAIWYRRAAKQGHIQAQLSLGLSYMYGDGVPQDLEEASKWLKKAALQDDVTAQVHLANVYHTGMGMRQDMQKASKWYRMAAENGDSVAQYNLGMLYRLGQGVEQDHTQSRRWLWAAAQQNNAPAQDALLKEEKRRDISSDQKDSIAPTAKSAIAAQLDAALALKLDEKISFVPAKSTVIQKNTNPLSSTIDSAITLASIAGIPQTVAVAATMTPELDAAAVYAAQKKHNEKKHYILNEATALQVAAAVTPRAEPNAPVDDAISQRMDIDTKAVGSPDKKLDPKNTDARLISSSNDKAKKKLHDAALLAADGDADAQYNLANIYLLGDGTRVDFARAKKWYGKAASQGHAIAQYNLANLERLQQQIANDAKHMQKPEAKATMETTKTATIIKDGAMQNTAIENTSPTVSDGQHNTPGTGQRYRFFDLLFDDIDTVKTAKKDGVNRQASDTKTPDRSTLNAALATIDERDYSAAYVLLVPLAKKGDKDAQYRLGYLFHYGQGVKQDYEMAVSWYKRAAKQGQSDAQYQLDNILSAEKEIAR